MPLLMPRAEQRNWCGPTCRKFRRWCGVFALALLGALFSGTLAAQTAQAKLPLLTTTHAARRLTIEEASRQYPIRLQAVVTYYDPDVDPRGSFLFVADATGCIFVSLSTTPVGTLKAGDLIEITGVSGPGNFAPIIDHAVARKVRDERLPSIAPRVDMADLLTGEQDGQWVEVEGVVHAVRIEEGYLYLDISMRGGDIVAMSVWDGTQAAAPAVASLVDARIRLRGNAGTVFNNQRQMTGADILFPGLQTLTVEQAASVHPFDQAPEKIGSLLLYTAAAGLEHRVHIEGTVTLQWPGRMVCIEEKDQALCAQIEQTDRLRRGDRIDLLGFPVTGAFTPTLVHASYRLAPGTQVPVTTVVTADTILSSGNDAKLVTIDGRLIGHDRSATDPTILLASGKHVYSAILPAGYAAQDEELEDGSLLRITGICSMQADPAKWHVMQGFATANSFRILRNGPKDVVILERPSWWNAAHTLRMLVFALVLTLAALLRVLRLRQRIERQSLTIQDSERRFRHLATHDGLTQLPNRASILGSLQQALDQAQSKHASVCVALIDLDHFKTINDTLGHQAGDEVLRQSAQRLAATIRSTDVVGRYGGEEFLIVFNDMEQGHGAERCEIVRQALCAEPIRWQDNDLTITCSIGVASAHTPGSPALALVSSADHAMYAAKRQGRNRVVSADSLELLEVAG